MARAMGLFAQPHRFCSVSRRLRDRKPWLPLLQLSHKDYGTVTFIGDFGVVNLFHCFRLSFRFLIPVATASVIYSHSLPRIELLLRCHIGGQLWIQLIKFRMARGWCRY